MSAQDIPHRGPQTVTFTSPPPLPSAAYLPQSRSPSVDHPGEASSVNCSGSVLQAVTFRPKQYDEMRGISGIDFDDKIASAYSSINQFDDKRVLHGHPDQIISQDISQKGANATVVVSVKRMLYCFILIALLGFFLALAAGGLAAYSFLLSFQNGEAIGDRNAAREMELMIVRLSSMVEELNQNLSDVSLEQETRYSLLTSQISQISGSVETIVGPQEENSYVSLPSLNDLRSIPVFQNCTTTRYGQCTPASNILTPNTPPTFGVCETASVALDEPGLTNLNIYCAFTNVDPDQAEINPSISTLNVSGGQVSCSCNLLVLSNAFAVNGIRCELYITRCPTNLQPGSPH